MTMKIITARQRLDRFVFAVHLDVTKVDKADATKPDERYVLRREWPLKAGAQKTGYLDAIRVELQAEAIARLAYLVDEDAGGTVLPQEGLTFG